MNLSESSLGNKLCMYMHIVYIYVCIYACMYRYQYRWGGAMYACDKANVILKYLMRGCVLCEFESVFLLLIDFSFFLSFLLSFFLSTPTTNECPGYDTQQSVGEALEMLEFWRMRRTPSLPSIPS